MRGEITILSKAPGGMTYRELTDGLEEAAQMLGAIGGTEIDLDAEVMVSIAPECVFNNRHQASIRALTISISEGKRRTVVTREDLGLLEHVGGRS